MPDYECKTVPLNKLLLQTDGVVESLCNDCVAHDCTNPIREKTISVMGIPKKMRVWSVRDVVSQVIDCRGYISKESHE
jgi:hypothetical protein